MTMLICRQRMYISVLRFGTLNIECKLLMAITHSVTIKIIRMNIGIFDGKPKK